EDFAETDMPHRPRHALQHSLLMSSASSLDAEDTEDTEEDCRAVERTPEVSEYRRRPDGIQSLQSGHQRRTQAMKADLDMMKDQTRYIKEQLKALVEALHTREKVPNSCALTPLSDGPRRIAFRTFDDRLPPEATLPGGIMM
ncbi:unnamed protein product, partial [Polarella glacialis]